MRSKAKSTAFQGATYPSPDHGRGGGMNVGGRGGFIYKLMTVFVAFALLGLGCKEKVLTQTPAHESTDAGAEAEREAEDVEEERADAGAPDSGRVIPEGWQIYRNPAWGIAQLAYPEGWHWRERTVEETGDPNSLWVDFNRDPIEQIIGADPVYPLLLVVNASDDLSAAMAEYFIEGVEAKESVQIGGVSFTKLTYISDLAGDTPFSTFFLVRSGRVYEVIAPADLPELTTFLTSLAAGGV